MPWSEPPRQPRAPGAGQLGQAACFHSVGPGTEPRQPTEIKASSVSRPIPDPGAGREPGHCRVPPLLFPPPRRTKRTVGSAPLGCILWYCGSCQLTLPPLLPPLSCRQPALHTPQFIKNPGYLGRDNTIVYLLQLPGINGLPLLILEWNFWQKTSIQKGKLL